MRSKCFAVVIWSKILVQQIELQQAVVSKCHSDLFGMSQHLPFRSGITVKCLNCPPLAFSKYGAGSDDLIQS